MRLQIQTLFCFSNNTKRPSFTLLSIKPGICFAIYWFSAFIAERRGFEPRIPFWGIHAFQACLFNHSSTSPFRGAKVEEVFGFTKCFVQIINQKIYYIRILQVKNRKRLLLSKIIITFALPLMYDNKCDICNGKALSPRRCVYRIYC